MITCRYCGSPVPGDLSCQHCGAPDVWDGEHPVSPPIVFVKATRFVVGLDVLYRLYFSDGVVIQILEQDLGHLIDNPKLSVSEIGNIIRFHWEELCIPEMP